MQKPRFSPTLVPAQAGTTPPPTNHPTQSLPILQSCVGAVREPPSPSARCPSQPQHPPQPAPSRTRGPTLSDPNHSASRPSSSLDPSPQPTCHSERSTAEPRNLVAETALLAHSCSCAGRNQSPTHKPTPPITPSPSHKTANSPLPTTPTAC